MNEYRHEYKYICDAMQIAVLKCRISGLLQRDQHSDENGAYQIRSLYFDDYSNTCYYENESGVDKRDKYRIRIYNADCSKIVLEKKSKNHGMTKKISAIVDEEQCRKLMRNEAIDMDVSMPLQLRKLLLEMKEKNMRPTVIVEYTRFPFVYKSGNVRITFDENIRTSSGILNFLDKEIITRPILEKGKSVLEVKWDEFIPDYISKTLQLDTLQWSSFSKYYLCRKFNYYGGLKL